MSAKTTKTEIVREKTTPISIMINEDGDSVLTAHTEKGDSVLKGISKVNLSYSTKGRAKGTKCTVSIVTPILKDGVSAVREETYELPKDLEDVLTLSTFWDKHAIKVKSDDNTQTKAKAKKSKKSKTAKKLEEVEVEVEEEVQESEIEELIEVN